MAWGWLLDLWQAPPEQPPQSPTQATQGVPAAPGEVLESAPEVAVAAADVVCRLIGQDPSKTKMIASPRPLSADEDTSELGPGAEEEQVLCLEQVEVAKAEMQREIQQLKMDIAKDEVGLEELRRYAMAMQQKREEASCKLVALFSRSFELQDAIHREKERRRRAQKRAASKYRSLSLRPRDRSVPPVKDRSEPLDDKVVLKRLVAVEAAVLTRMEGQERERLRQRILAKWQPDKNTHAPALAARLTKALMAHPSFAA